MNKKMYKKPETDLVRMYNGEPVMERMDQGLPTSGSAREPGKTT